MKNFFLFLLLVISVGAFGQIDKYVPKQPSPPKLVNDFTNTLTVEQVHALEEKLVAYDDSTSSQIAVVIIPTTGDYPIEDVALRILREWGVGGREKSNGIVLLVAKDDRKVRIEVGYGLEGAIPDMIAASIIDHEIVPNFKEGREGNYYRGLDAGTNAIIEAAAGEYQAPEGYGSRKNKGISIGTIIFIVILLIIIFGSAGGRGGGGYVSRRGYRGWWLPTGGWTGGGWSGGGGGWSGGGGGGFGGFGGGSGGGGGASGSW